LNSDIACLKELKTLDLSNNDFSDIPSEIGYMQKLVRISLEGNPLKCIRSSVRSAGTEGLKKYLRERVDTEEAKSEIIKEYTSVSKIDVWDQMIKDFLIEGKNLIINDR
jgi:Leucine-rich repeat (LRR) protein